MNPETTDRIIAAHRPTDADVDAELSPTRRAQILDDIVEAPAAVIPLRRPSRRLPVLVAAGTAVAALALAVQAILPGQVQTVVTTDPSGATATTTVTQAPAGLPAAALEPVARAAAARVPMKPQGSQLVRVTETIKAKGFTSTAVRYTAADGWTWGKVDAGDGSAPVWLLSNPSDEADAQRFAGLPADPAALDAELRKHAGSDALLFLHLQNLLLTPGTPQNVKSAAILLLDKMAKAEQPTTGSAAQRLSLAPVTVNGQAGVRATMSFYESGKEMASESVVLAQATGDVLETSSVNGPSTHVVTYSAPSLVDALPAEFVQNLGTQKVAKQIPADPQPSTPGSVVPSAKPSTR